MFNKFACASCCLIAGIVLGPEVWAAEPAVLSAAKIPGVATPEGRLLIGRGEDYVPSAEDSQVLFDKLESSMKARR